MGAFPCVKAVGNRLPIFMPTGIENRSPLGGQRRMCAAELLPGAYSLPPLLEVAQKYQQIVDEIEHTI